MSYSIQYADFGVVIRISDTLGPQLAERWHKEAALMFEGFEGTFHVLLDLRGNRPSSNEDVFDEATALLRKGLERGVERLAVVTDNKPMRRRVSNVLESTGSPDLVRWFDAHEDLAWRRHAKTWLRGEAASPAESHLSCGKLSGRCE